MNTLLLKMKELVQRRDGSAGEFMTVPLPGRIGLLCIYVKYSNIKRNFCLLWGR